MARNTSIIETAEKAAKPAANRAPRARKAALAVVPDAESTDIPTEAITVEVMETAAFEALGRTERIDLMKAEAAATREWIAGGKVGPEPPRPVNNAYVLGTLAAGGRVNGPATKGERKSRSNFEPDALADVLHRIREMRDNGLGWPTIAKNFNAQGVPTAKGGTWASSTVRSIAMRAGMPTRLDKPEVEAEAAAPAKPKRERNWDSRGRGRSKAAK